VAITVELVKYAQEVDLSTGNSTHALYFRFNSGRLIRAVLVEEDMEVLLRELGGPELPPEEMPEPPPPPVPAQLPVEPATGAMQETDYGYEFTGAYSQEPEQEEEQAEEEPPPPPPPPPPPKRKGKSTPKATILAHTPPRRTVAADENGYPVLPNRPLVQPAPTPVHIDPYVDEDGVGSI